MSTTKNTDKIDKLILNYFKLVNPLPYDEVKINYIEFFDMYDIKIVSENYLDYTRYRRDGSTVYGRIMRDMEYMFPYTFRVSVVVKRVINKTDGVRTNY
jgi:hypothetical protein